MRVLVKVEPTAAGGFRAVCPALPGCVAEGRTRDEAWREIARVAQGYVASLNMVDRLELHENEPAQTGA